MGLKSLFTRSSKKKPKSTLYLPDAPKVRTTKFYIPSYEDKENKPVTKNKAEKIDKKQQKLNNFSSEDEDYLQVELKQYSPHNGDYEEPRPKSRRRRRKHRPRKDNEIQWTIPSSTQCTQTKEEVISVRMSNEGMGDATKQNVTTIPSNDEEKIHETKCTSKIVQNQPREKKTRKKVNTPNGRKFSPQIHEQCILRIRKLKKQCEVYKAHIAKLHQKHSIKRLENSNKLKVKKLSSENKHLHEDIEALKSVIYRLNEELFKLQNSRDLTTKQVTPVQSQKSLKDENPYDIPAETSLLEQPNKNLMPLLKAYDEALKEKIEIIDSFEAYVQKFNKRVTEVLEENKQLHEFVATKKESEKLVTWDEWTALQATSSLVLEENELLQERIKVLQNKVADLHEIGDKKQLQYDQDTKATEKKIMNLKATISALENHCTTQDAKYSALQAITDSRISQDVHETSLFECRRLLEELKIKHIADKSNLENQVIALEKERDRLIQESAEAMTANAKLETSLHQKDLDIKDREREIKNIQSALNSIKNERDDLEDKIREMIVLTEKVVEERELLEESLQEQQSIHEEMFVLKSKHSQLVTELKNNIEIMKKLQNADIEKLTSKIKDLEKSNKSLMDRLATESGYLNSLLDEKSKIVSALESEKRQLQDDLETVWRVSTSTSGTLQRCG